MSYNKLPIIRRVLHKLLTLTAPLYSDSFFLKAKYYLIMGRRLNLETPQTYNEKLQWLKLYDRNPLYTTLVDKYRVKQWLADKFGEQYIIPTLAVYNSVEEIDLDKLPNQFVSKCNHDSGSVVICRDKSSFDLEAAKRELDEALKKNFYWEAREWPYKNVKSRIIAEQYMNNDGQELDDYKVHNFNGEPKVVLVCSDRYKKSGLAEDFYSCEWEHLDISRPGIRHSAEVQEKPAELDEMLDLAKKLSVGIPFVRTDFYIINHQVYFGEMTFFPACGMKPFVPREWDYKLGSFSTLPQ
jgi:hypothetical protein